MGDYYKGQERRRSISDDVNDARAAVVATTRSLDRISEMLSRHFRLGIVALSAAVLLGGSMFYVVSQVHNTQQAIQRQARMTQVQAVANEIEVLRHRVNEREGHQRLCVVALGASRPPEVAAQICEPVVGDDYDDLKLKLNNEEFRLAKLRADL